jgi:hypothetical protein
MNEKTKEKKQTIKKHGVIKAYKTDTPLLKGHVTHLINHG